MLVWLISAVPELGGAIVRLIPEEAIPLDFRFARAERQTATRAAFAAVDHEQDRLLGIQPPLDQICQQLARQSGVLGAPFPQPERDLYPVGGDPERTTWVRPAISIPSSIITARRTSSSRRLISSSRAVRVRSMNSSDTVDFDVELHSRSTSWPTGSPTEAYLRVDTPASI